MGCAQSSPRGPATGAPQGPHKPAVEAGKGPSPATVAAERQQSGGSPTCGNSSSSGPLPACTPGPSSQPPACCAGPGSGEVPPTTNAGWDDDARVASLRALGVLGAPPEPRFDMVVQLVKQLFQVQVALVSLVDAEELYFLARAGEWGCGCSRSGAFCDWALVPATPTLVVVEDASKDPRFCSNPFVTGPPGVRFYAGAPLVASDSGYRLGTLCVIDFQPRTFAAEQYQMLIHFAEVVIRELERDKMLKRQHQALGAAAAAQQAMLRTLDCFTEGVMLCDTSRPHWPLLYVNDAWVAATGVGREAALAAEGFWALFQPQQEQQEQQQQQQQQASESEVGGSMGAGGEVAAAAAAARGELELRVALRGPAGAGGSASTSSGSGGGLLLQLRPAGTAEQLREGIPQVGIPGFVPMEAGGSGSGSSSSSSSSSSSAEPGGGGLGGGKGGASSGGEAAGRRYYFGLIPGGSAGQGQREGSVPASSSAGVGNQGSSAGTSMKTQDGSPADSAPSASQLAHVASGRAVPAQLLPVLQKFRSKVMNEVTLGPLIGTSTRNGRCYRALWRGGQVTIKVLESQVPRPVGGSSLSFEEELGTAAVAEAVLSRSLAHPHIVSTFEYGVSNEEMVEGSEAGTLRQVVWIIQSYADRGSLYDAIERGLLRGADGEPDLGTILAAATEICSALSYLHARSILHGGLTPSNVLLTAYQKDARGWIVQVGDFGLSQVVRGEAAVAATDLGTITHMAPELLRAGKLSPAADCYAFAVILCEMWSGQRAWQGRNPEQLRGLIASGDERLEPPTSAPSVLHGVMWRCLDADPAQRPTFDALLAELDALRRAERCSSLEAAARTAAAG